MAEITTDMDGVIIRINVEEGVQVEPGDVVAVMESMKIEMDVESSVGGVITAILVEEEQQVDEGTVLFEVEPSS